MNGAPRLSHLLDGASRAVFFTGAGVSTESGIPDFRSPGGLWSRYRPIDFAEFIASAESRREAWRRKFAVDAAFRQAAPNRGHRAIFELWRRGKAARVITQNIDGLHQASGLPPEAVIELHGNGSFAKCLDCGLRHELDPIYQTFMRDGDPPPCSDCGGILKAATISFGQAMPEREMAQAEIVSAACDLFVVLGSSLAVFPAAGYPVRAKQGGANLVIINREPTPLDALADLVLHGEIGSVLGEAAGVD